MKRIFPLILFICMVYTCIGQQWTTGRTNTTFHEPYSGTNITTGYNRLDVYTDVNYTDISTITHLEIIIYDSLSRFVGGMETQYPNPDKDVVSVLYEYNTGIDGFIYITISGTGPHQPGIIGYTIAMPTYYRQQKYEAILRRLLR